MGSQSCDFSECFFPVGCLAPGDVSRGGWGPWTRGMCDAPWSLTSTRPFSQELAGRAPLLSLCTKGRGANSRDLKDCYLFVMGLASCSSCAPPKTKCAFSCGLQPVMALIASRVRPLFHGKAQLVLFVSASAFAKIACSALTMADVFEFGRTAEMAACDTIACSGKNPPKYWPRVQ